MPCLFAPSSLDFLEGMKTRRKREGTTKEGKECKVMPPSTARNVVEETF